MKLNWIKCNGLVVKSHTPLETEKIIVNANEGQIKLIQSKIYSIKDIKYLCHISSGSQGLCDNIITPEGWKCWAKI